MNIILLVRGADVLCSAIDGANRFLVSQRQHFAAPRQGGEVLGIWLKGDLDEGLPALFLGDRQIQAVVGSDSLTGETDCRPDPGEAAVGIEWSFTHSGLWSLCWMDGVLLREAKDSAERRRRILEALLSPAFALRFSQRPGRFFPVFGAIEASDSIDAAMRELQSDYPQLIGATRFVDDPRRGILGTGP